MTRTSGAIWRIFTAGKTGCVARREPSRAGTWDVGVGPRRLTAPGLRWRRHLSATRRFFSGAVVESGPNRPQWLLNVTSDGWFGKTSGPYQHFAQARLRAIEEGLPLVRAANTGISAIVDPYGRVQEQLPLGVEG